MTDAPSWQDLRAIPDDRWRTIALPGGEPEVSLTRLHVDQASGASLSLVRFPAGWARPVVGCYPVGEEIVVLDGALTISGEHLGAGDYGWVPPRAVRSETASPGGALVLAMFTGPPQWSTDPAESRPGAVFRHHLAVGPLRPVTDGVTGTASFTTVDGAEPVDRDLTDVEAARWAFVPAGAAPPPTEGDDVIVRTWP